MDRRVTPTDIIDEILEKGRVMSRPIYRGQGKAGWKLHSGAVDRLSRTNGDKLLDDENDLRKRVHDYHKDLILRMAVIDGEQMSDLQRLSILQHQGAATGLLDFTENPLVALWFACSEKPGSDGKVFIVDIGHQVAANGRLLKDESLFTTERAVYYEPDRSLGARIVAQQSVFVICNPPQIPDGCLQEVDVPRGAKESVREYLERVGLSKYALFGDVPGLARANTRGTPLPRKDMFPPEHYRDRGNRAYQEELYADALSQYERYAAALPDVAQPQCLIGDTLAVLGRSREAIKAYTRAIERIDRPIDLGRNVIVNWEAVGRFMLHTLYYNRGNAHAAEAHHLEAITDFDSALQHGNELKRNVLFNRGNSKYGQERFLDALGDFEAAWSELDGSDAALAMGNCKVMMGHFPNALRRYLEGVSVGRPEDSATGCRKNAGQIRELLAALGERLPQVKRKGKTVYVEADCGTANFPMVGNRGNAGNTPSGIANARGGSGYGGRPGFAVVLVQRHG